jgi:putative sterol carrier protein
MSDNGMTDVADFSSVDPDQFANLLTQVTDEQIEEGMRGPMRKQILDEIFNRMSERFESQKAGATDAVVHFNITDRSDGGTDSYEVVIKDGKLEVSDNPSQDPRVTLTMGPVPFMRLVSGSESGPVLFMSGKLKIEGDLMFASQMTTLFKIPKAAA